MIIHFDALDRFERPLFHLCNPGAKYEHGVLTRAIGILSDTSDEELELNFNSTSTLSLRAYKRKYEDPEQDEHFKSLFSKLQNRRLIFIDDIGFFSITSVSKGLEGDLSYKDIEAESCEEEMAQKALPYIEDGTYAFDDLLSLIANTVPMWTVAHVDSSVSTKYRSFEDVNTDQNVLSFLLSDMQDAYECIFVFDPINRLINVYDQNTYIRETGIHLSSDDIVDSLEVSEDSEDMYTGGCPKICVNTRG